MVRSRGVFLGAATIGPPTTRRWRRASLRVRSGSANPPTVWAFELIAHSASRFNEVRGMQWSEMDDSWTVWTIPAERSKDFREHRKPISRQVRDILMAIRQYQTMQGITTDLVVCNRQGRPIGTGTVRKLLHGYQIEHTVHGLRSAFRSWALETGGAMGLRRDAAQSQPGQRGRDGLHPQRPSRPTGGDDAAVERLH